MGIDVFIQNRLHERTETILDYDLDALDRLIERAPRGSLTQAIHPYADTMFNPRQLQSFLAELSEFSPSDDKEAQLIAVLRRAAETALERFGYLWFSGD
ncbi:hypothetical protein ACFYTQ_33890 [Nocardia sp. NPDC004068]|uniref:hypothetical protein n=1 Tax=Nocardia sp. NPDC004068 TaxID=3364303 RepID=UPI0036AF3E4E